MTETFATALPYIAAGLAALLLAVGLRGLRAARRNAERVRQERQLRLRSLLKGAGVDEDDLDEDDLRIDLGEEGP